MINSSLKKNLIQFTLTLFLSLSILFVIHIGILHLMNLPLFGNVIILSYVINFFMAYAIFIILLVLNKNYGMYSGYIFLGGSLFKFLFFFLIFYPIYKEDGTIYKSEFFTFFLPYILCLIIETLGGIRLLKSK